MALHDSRLPLACDHLDEAVVRLLEVRSGSAKDVGRRLPRLVARMAAAHDGLQELVFDLGRFDPPDAQTASAQAVADMAQLTHAFVASVLECAAHRLDTVTWESARDLLGERDRLLASAYQQGDADIPDPDDRLRFERTLGLSTAMLAAGDGLTFASRVAAAWVNQLDFLDGRLYAALPHLLDPAIPLSDKVRMHLTELLGSARPFVAHQVAVAARDLVLRALSANRSATLAAIAEEVTQEPVMYFTHQCLVDAASAFNEALGPQEQMRPALQMYNPVMEGDVRRVARLVLQLLGRQVPSDTTLTPIASQLAAEMNEPVCLLLASCIAPAWRNAIAHEHVWWDSIQQRAILAGEPVEPWAIGDAALRAHEMCSGFETGVAIALNQAGNPHDYGDPTENEIAASIRMLRTLGNAGITASKLHRKGATVRLLIPALTILTMDHLHLALIQAAARMPDVIAWDIRQTPNRSPYRISRDAITTVCTFKYDNDSGQPSVVLPVAALPMVYSGLIAYDADSPTNIPSIIALAAMNILGEQNRLAPKLAAADKHATSELIQVLEYTARAVEATATLEGVNNQPELQAFARLILDTQQKLAAQEISASTSFGTIEMAFRSSAPAYLPWLHDEHQ